MKIIQSVIKSSKKVLPGLIPVFFFAVFVLMPGRIVAVNVPAVQSGPTVHVAEGDEWRYFKGTSKPPYKWTHVDFDDSNWLNGMTGLGYGRSSRTYLGDMQGNYSAVYSRRQFNINNIYAVAGMNLSIVCDGAFITYLNSVEIIRNDSVNISGSTPSPQAEQLDVSGFIHELLPGKNVLSVECNNDVINSKDFSFIPVFKVFEHQGEQAQ